MDDKVFDRNRLDDHELGHLEYVLMSPSYLQVFRPFLEGCRDMYAELLALPDPVIRNTYGGTKYLRCGQNNMKKFIEFLDHIVAEAQADRAMQAREELGKTDLYAEAKRQGKLVEQEYRPEEDY